MLRRIEMRSCPVKVPRESDASLFPNSSSGFPRGDYPFLLMIGRIGDNFCGKKGLHINRVYMERSANKFQVIKIQKIVSFLTYNGGRFQSLKLN